VDILERAARVDPEGNRTIGVLTKPDLIGTQKSVKQCSELWIESFMRLYRRGKRR
jgi:hypothetical protein